MLFLAISLQYRLFVCASLFGLREQTSVFFFVQCHKTSCPGKPVCLDYAVIPCFNFTLVCKLDKLYNSKEI